MQDTIYRSIQHVECWGIEQDARHYLGPHPVVAHPPCSTWGRLAHTTKAGPSNDGGCAEAAIAAVRRWGGVLEHPAWSGIFYRFGLAFPDHYDSAGGWTIEVEQGWWGHSAPKPTWLYVVGVDRVDLPAVRPHATGRVKSLGRKDRSATPPALAAWLVDIARRSRPSTAASTLLPPQPIRQVPGRPRPGERSDIQSRLTDGLRGGDLPSLLCSELNKPPT